MNEVPMIDGSIDQPSIIDHQIRGRLARNRFESNWRRDERPPMAKARAIVKRRKSVQNIRKITRTMELIATARFKKALDRATAGGSLHPQDRRAGRRPRRDRQDVSHPLLEVREPAKKSLLLMLTSNRGLAGGYNGNVIRCPTRTLQDYATDRLETRLEVSGKRGISPSAGSGASRSTRPTSSSRTGRSSTRSRCWPTATSGCSSGRDRPGRRRLHPVHQLGPAGGGRPDPPADDRGAGRPRRSIPSARPSPTTKSDGEARPRNASLTSSSRTPRASSKRSYRSRSRSASSSASSTPPSASRSPGWSPCEARPRTPTTWSRTSPCSTIVPDRPRSPASWPRSSAAPRRSNKSPLD